MNKEEIQLLITGFMLLIPFGVLWFIAFRYLKKYIKTALGYSILILLTLLGLIAYFLLTFYISDTFLSREISNLIGPASFATVLLCYMLSIPSFLVTLVLAIIHFARRKHKNE